MTLQEDTMSEEQRRRIEENDIELERMRQELGIRPRMSIVRTSTTPKKTDFSLRELNKELIATIRNKVTK